MTMSSILTSSCPARGSGGRCRLPRISARHLVTPEVVPRRRERLLPRQSCRDHLALSDQPSLTWHETVAYGKEPVVGRPDRAIGHATGTVEVRRPWMCVSRRTLARW
jgi:hypothetical protein